MNGRRSKALRRVVCARTDRIKDEHERARVYNAMYRELKRVWSSRNHDAGCKPPKRRRELHAAEKDALARGKLMRDPLTTC